MKDPYKALGVTKSASAEEIKAAYRRPRRQQPTAGRSQMIRACSSFVAILSALTIVFAASQPAVALVNAPEIARPADPVILVTGTRVGDMTPQMRTAYIRGLQEELATHDYHPGPADGIMGPMTRGAIRHYQRDAGLEVDGVPPRSCSTT